MCAIIESTAKVRVLASLSANLEKKVGIKEAFTWAMAKTPHIEPRSPLESVPYTFFTQLPTRSLGHGSYAIAYML